MANMRLSATEGRPRETDNNDFATLLWVYSIKESPEIAKKEKNSILGAVVGRIEALSQDVVERKLI